MEKHIPFRLMALFLVITLIIGVTSKCQAQTSEELNKKILETKPGQIDPVEIKVERIHRKFQAGTLLQIGGLVVGGLGFIKREHHEQKPNEPEPILQYNYPLFIIGGGMIAAGTVIQVHSFKQLSREMNWRLFRKGRKK